MADIIFCTRAWTTDWIIVGSVFRSNEYRLPEDMTGMTFVDIGGHIGSASILAATRGARVIAYEPSSDNARLFEENVRANKLNIKVIWKAVGPRGKGKLINDTHNTGASTMYQERNDFGGTEKDTEEVDMVPLSEVLQDIDDCFLKMDCEGGELEIIPEIVAGLHTKIRNMAIEFHFEDKKEALIDTLRPFYEVEKINRYVYSFKHL